MYFISSVLLSPAEEKLRTFKNEVLKIKEGSLEKVNNTTGELFSEVAKQIEARIAVNDTSLKKGAEGLKALISDIFNKSNRMIESNETKKTILDCLKNICKLFGKAIVWGIFFTINDAIKLLFSCMKVLNEAVLLFPVVMIASIVFSLMLRGFARLTNFIFSKVGLISKNDFDYNKLLEEKLEEVKIFTRAKFINEKSSVLNNLLGTITKNIRSYNSPFKGKEVEKQIKELNGINTLKYIDLTEEQELAIEMIMSNVVKAAEKFEKKVNFEERDKKRLGEINTAVSNINFIIGLLNAKVSENSNGERELNFVQVSDNKYNKTDNDNINEIKNIFSGKLVFKGKESEGLDYIDYKDKESKKKSIKSAFLKFGIDLDKIDKYDEYGHEKKIHNNV